MAKTKRRVTEDKVQNLARLLFELYSRKHDVGVSTFQDAGILDRHARGLVLRFGNDEFQLSIKQSR